MKFPMKALVLSFSLLSISFAAQASEDDPYLPLNETVGGAVGVAVGCPFGWLPGLAVVGATEYITKKPMSEAAAYNVAIRGGCLLGGAAGAYAGVKAIDALEIDTPSQSELEKKDSQNND